MTLSFATFSSQKKLDPWEWDKIKANITDKDNIEAYKKMVMKDYEEDHDENDYVRKSVGRGSVKV